MAGVCARSEEHRRGHGDPPQDSFEIAERVSEPALRRAWLTFVVVGAGATGVEVSGAIAEIARQTLKNDFRSIHPDEAQIILLDGAPRILMPFPEKLAEKASRTLAKLGVQVKCSAMVNHVDGDGLIIESFGRAEPPATGKTGYKKNSHPHALGSENCSMVRNNFADSFPNKVDGGSLIRATSCFTRLGSVKCMFFGCEREL